MNPWLAAIFGGVFGAVLGSRATRRRMERKVTLALAAAEQAQAVGGVYLLPESPDSGEGVFALGPACTDWRVIDRPRLELLLKHAYYSARLQGLNTPYEVSDAVLRQLLPTCRTRETGIRNLDELDLYGTMFTSVADMLYTEGELSDDELSILANDFDHWYASQQEELQ